VGYEEGSKLRIDYKHVKQVWLFLLLIFLCDGVYAEDRKDIWAKEQLNESYMRSLSKDECMIKTINTLKVCNSDACLKNLGGIAGDCITWASGEENSFCADYEEKYIRIYCRSDHFDDRLCYFLDIVYDVMCKRHRK
jgi:hypothetical protein